MWVHVAQDEAERWKLINRVIKQRIPFDTLDHAAGIPAYAEPESLAQYFRFGQRFPDCEEIADEEEQEHGKETRKRPSARLLDASGSLKALYQAVADAVGPKSAECKEKP